MSRPMCGTCLHWNPLGSPLAEHGQCRRYAPKPGDACGPEWLWPEIAPNEWCGEHLASVVRTPADDARQMEASRLVPRESKPATPSGHKKVQTCPVCKGNLRLFHGKYGAFYGHGRHSPTGCAFTSEVEDFDELVKEWKEEKRHTPSCEKCNKMAALPGGRLCVYCEDEARGQ